MLRYSNLKRSDIHQIIQISNRLTIYDIPHWPIDIRLFQLTDTLELNISRINQIQQYKLQHYCITPHFDLNHEQEMRICKLHASRSIKYSIFITSYTDICK